MHPSLPVMALAASMLAAPAIGQSLGKAPPELKATKWYNSPPLTLADLRGRAVLIEVFRTW